MSHGDHAEQTMKLQNLEKAYQLRPEAAVKKERERERERWMPNELKFVVMLTFCECKANEQDIQFALKSPATFLHP